MDEYSKLYDSDEKGVSGILLLLLCLLLTIEPILGIISATIWSSVFSGYAILKAVFIGMAVVFILFSFIAGFVLLKTNRHAVSFLKAFLIYRLPYLLATAIANMSMQLGAIHYGRNTPEYSAEFKSIMISFAVGFLYITVFSVGWYLYLLKSGRVRETFPTKSGCDLSRPG